MSLVNVCEPGGGSLMLRITLFTSKTCFPLSSMNVCRNSHVASECSALSPTAVPKEDNKNKVLFFPVVLPHSPGICCSGPSEPEAAPFV